MGALSGGIGFCSYVHLRAASLSIEFAFGAGLANSTVSFLVAVMNYTEMESKVREATNNEPWGASSTLMQEIANGTHS